MLSGIVQSPRAVAANSAIMRAFVRMRRALSERGDILARLEKIEDEVRTHTTTTDKNLRLVFETLRRLLDDDSDTTAGRIGFQLPACINEKLNIRFRKIAFSKEVIIHYSGIYSNAAIRAVNEVKRL